MTLAPHLRPFALLLVAITCLYSLLARDTYTADFRAYYVAAAAAQDHLDPYQNNINLSERYADGDWLQTRSRFIYPPSSLFLFAPFARLDYRAAKFLFATLMAVILAFTLFFLTTRFPLAAWAAVALFFTLPAAANIDNGQIDILILALSLTAFYARPALGGPALGIAIALKLSPIFIVLWLLTQGRWQSALYALLTAAAITAAALAHYGAPLYRESFEHLRHHLDPNPTYLTHSFQDGAVILGRFVVMGKNTYSLHYFFGTRQNPLLPLGHLAFPIGFTLVLAYLLWTVLTPRLQPETSFFAFLAIALLANTLLWPAGLVATLPFTLLLIHRSLSPTRDAALLLAPYFSPFQTFADHRFLLWLLAVAVTLYLQHRPAAQPSLDTGSPARYPV